MSFVHMPKIKLKAINTILRFTGKRKKRQMQALAQGKEKKEEIKNKKTIAIIFARITALLSKSIVKKT